MSWLTNLFKRKKQDTAKKAEITKIPPPSGKVFYMDYAPTGRTTEIRYLSPSDNGVQNTPQNSGDFFLSLMAAQATDSAALGMVIGGDPAGAMIGDMLSDSNHSSNDSHDYSSPSHDYSPSNDDYSSPSNDSWSSSNDWSSSSDSSSFGSDSSSSDSSSSFSSDSGGW